MAADVLIDTPFGVTVPLYGVCSTAGGPPGVVLRLGDHVLDLAALAAATEFELADDLAQPSLNAFMAHGRRAWSHTLEWVRTMLRQNATAGRLVPLSDVTPHL